MREEKRDQFKKAAAEIRKLTIQSMAAAGFGHIGGSMSICELLAVLYDGILDIDPKKPDKKDRDWLVLSKGHCGPALYAALAYKGYFDTEQLATLNRNGTLLPSHCDRLKTCGIDLSTGSLGQGVSLGIGAAMGMRLRGLERNVFVIVGDGELQEGQVWEGVQFASHRRLDNFVLIVDCNKRQLDGWVNDLCKPYEYQAKFSAFGFDAFEANGQDCEDIYHVLRKAKQAQGPAVVLLDTEKGQGCSFAEKVAFNHYMVINEMMAEEAIREIDRRLKEGMEI